MSEEYLIVGLGNPGEKYHFTRHNVGFLVLERIAEQLQLKFSNSSVTKAVTAEANVKGKQVVLMLPLTFMNKSGAAVKEFIERKNILPQRLMIVTDDFNLIFGQLRLRPSGSDGGHNGLESIIRLLGNDEFSRLRLGIGQPGNGEDVVDYVLDEFTKNEKDCLNDFVQSAADCCLCWLDEGIEQAMNQYNRRKENE